MQVSLGRTVVALGAVTCLAASSVLTHREPQPHGWKEVVFHSRSPVVQRVLSLRAYGFRAWTTAMSRHWPISLRNVPANICPGAIRG